MRRAAGTPVAPSGLLCSMSSFPWDLHPRLSPAVASRLGLPSLRDSGLTIELIATRLNFFEQCLEFLLHQGATEVGKQFGGRLDVIGGAPDLVGALAGVL